MKAEFSDNWIDCTGDACACDVIKFIEFVWGGSFRKPKKLGERLIIAKILKDSYGAEKQQHTFTIEIIHSEGYDPLSPGKKTTRKGRNIYRNGTYRKPWENESERQKTLNEKHQRGSFARAERFERKMQEWSFR